MRSKYVVVLSGGSGWNDLNRYASARNLTAPVYSSKFVCSGYMIRSRSEEDFAVSCHVSVNLKLVMGTINIKFTSFSFFWNLGKILYIHWPLFQIELITREPFKILSTMSQSIQSFSEGQLYLIGVGVSHSIAPPMHNIIAEALNKPWNFSNLECPTIQDVLIAIHRHSFKGGVITMPYKQAIIPHLSGLDKQAELIGAVNNVYIAPDGKLRGTNTDWEGVKGCLLSAVGADKGRGKPALVIGAGGASRAAVYALSADLGCHTIYVINRDGDEVEALIRDSEKHGLGKLKLIHVTSVSQAESLPCPFFVVGTVPDFEPKTNSEIEMRKMLEVLLSTEQTGVILDMCFKPRNTRTLKLARSLGWSCVEGTGVIGYQIETQWKLWTGEDVSSTVPKKKAWEILNKGAEESKAINF
jgi:quinate dehydrogenase